MTTRSYHIVAVLSILFSLVFMAPSCSSKKRAMKEANIGELKARNFDQVQSRAEKFALDTEWLHGKGKVTIDDPSFGKITATLDARWQKDEQLWVMVKKFGFEAARMLIKKDSVFMINRLEKSYIATDFEGLSRKYNVPLNFDLVQTLVLGNYWNHETTNQTVAIDSVYYRMYADDQRINSNQWLYGGNYRLHRLLVEDKKERQSLDYQLTNFKKLENGVFPYDRSLALLQDQKTRSEVDIAFSDVKAGEPVKMTFSIPSGYKQVVL